MAHQITQPNGDVIREGEYGRTRDGRKVGKRETVTLTAEMVGGYPVAASARPNVSTTFDVVDGWPSEGTFTNDKGETIRVEHLT